MTPRIHEFGMSLLVNQYPNFPEMRTGPILNPVAQAVIDVNVGRFIRAFRRITIAHEDRIDLPILVSWSVRIIRSKWWPALGQDRRREASEGG